MTDILHLVPAHILEALQMLHDAGYEAYLVGGCVRDLLRGVQPNDYDITTAALPKEVETVFADYHVIETGLKHGTVTVHYKHMPLEITTYRVDGKYSDGRHPDRITFTETLAEDLKRRDFTMNAMAWSPQDGLVDLFGGLDDLQAGIIRCVGEASERFHEDALRILRAARFASVLGYSVAPETASAMIADRLLLRNISAERIAVELTKMLCGSAAEKVLLQFHTVIEAFIPELTPCVGYPQATRYHCYDVFTHTCKVVAAIRPVPVLRLAALLHDIEKPSCFAFYDGEAHFKGHPAKSAETAVRILRRLRFDRDTIQKVEHLILYHDIRIPAEREPVCRLLQNISPEEAGMLTELMEADNLAKSAVGVADIPKIHALRDTVSEVLASNPCLRVTDLAIRGKDLREIGVQDGSEMGDILKELLELVIAEKLPNEKEMLLREASVLLTKRGKA